MASVLFHLVIFHLVEHWRRTYFNQFRKPLTKVDQIIYSLARLYPSQKSCNAAFSELPITELLHSVFTIVLDTILTILTILFMSLPIMEDTCAVYAVFWC